MTIGFRFKLEPTDGGSRGAELHLSREGLRMVVNTRHPRLWCISLDLHKIRTHESAAQEKSGLHVSPIDHDGWNSIYYRRPGSLFYGVLVIGRRKTWFESEAERLRERQEAAPLS